MKLPWRALVANIVVPALVLAGVAPAVHAHEADGEHPHTVVHRHTHAHAGRHFTHLFSQAAVSDPDGSDRDEDAVWMDSQSVERPRLTISTGISIICSNVSFAPAPEGGSLAVIPCDSLPHGPPGVRSTPRAPPTPSV
jgi:hypothetical protein